MVDLERGRGGAAGRNNKVVGSTGTYDRYSGSILAAPDAMPRDPSTGAGSDSMPIPPNQVPIGNGTPIHLGRSSILIKLCDGKVAQPLSVLDDLVQFRLTFFRERASSYCCPTPWVNRDSPLMLFR